MYAPYRSYIPCQSSVDYRNTNMHRRLGSATLPFLGKQFEISTCAYGHCLHTSAMFPAFRQLHSDFGDFSNGVCHVMKITIIDSNHDKGLLTQQIFCFSHEVLTRANEISTVIMSASLIQFILESVALPVYFYFACPNWAFSIQVPRDAVPRTQELRLPLLKFLGCQRSSLLSLD